MHQREIRRQYMGSHPNRVAKVRMPYIGSAEVCGIHHSTQYIDVRDAMRQSRPRTSRVERQACNVWDEHPHIEPSFDLSKAGRVLLVRKHEELSE